MQTWKCPLYSWRDKQLAQLFKGLDGPAIRQLARELLEDDKYMTYHNSQSRKRSSEDVLSSNVKKRSVTIEKLGNFEEF
jgi:hypothetical protein